MTNYHLYNAIDFAADDFFKSWVCAPDRELNAFWGAFLEEFPEKYYELEDARLLVLNLNEIHENVASPERVDRIWTRIESSVGPARSRIIPLPSRLLWAAASVIVLMTTFLLWNRTEAVLSYSAGKNRSANGWKEVANTAEEPIVVHLPDKSQITLQKNSIVRFPETFDSPIREVQLVGEAFFEVSKNPKKPFLVYANNLVTKVLGTSFTIRSLENEPNVIVSVRTGLVSVYSERCCKDHDSESEGIVLTPNQKAVFQKDNALLSRTLIERPAIVLPETTVPSFVFEDASAAEVFAVLEKVYGIDIIFDAEVMRDCHLTVDLSKEDLFEKLAVICKVLDAQYKLIDAQVIIYSRSC